MGVSTAEGDVHTPGVHLGGDAHDVIPHVVPCSLVEVAPIHCHAVVVDRKLGIAGPVEAERYGIPQHDAGDLQMSMDESCMGRCSTPWCVGSYGQQPAKCRLSEPAEWHQQR